MTVMLAGCVIHLRAYEVDNFEGSDALTKMLGCVSICPRTFFLDEKGSLLSIQPPA